MNIFDFDIARFALFIMVFTRMGALMLSMPIFGSSVIPIHARLGLVALTSYLVFTAAPLPPIDMSISTWRFTLMLAGEVAVGLIIGFATQLVFTAVQLTGQTIGFQMGFAIVNVMDPVTNSQVSVTAQFKNILALMIFLAISGHHWLIFASAKSFELIPVLGFAPSDGLVELMIDLTSNVFVMALKIGAPIMATLFLLNVALGLVARTVPQMNVFIVGFPLQIGTGLFMIGITAPMFFHLFRDSMLELYANIITLMRLM
ncbi:MAG: flagellar biosynthetic protein FliR [Nitrospinota bacterium]